jgi:hypothetical protein
VWHSAHLLAVNACSPAAASALTGEVDNVAIATPRETINAILMFVLLLELTWVQELCYRISGYCDIQGHCEERSNEAISS